MTRARVGTCVALFVLAACGSFKADESGADSGTAAGDAGDAAAACVAETCAGAGPSCFYDDFGSGCSNVTFSGDTGNDVAGECKDGKLHVLAKNTLDMTAEITHSTPDTYDSIRISMSLALADWQLGRVLRLTLEGAPVAELDVAKAKSGNLSFTLCGSATSGCAAEAFEAAPAEAHRFTFDVTAKSVSVSVDCKPLAIRTLAVKLGPRANVGVGFGKPDADPVIDGTLDDLRIAFP
jgi:hypothetical protein